MRFVHSYVSSQDRYCLGVDTQTGTPYLAIPVGSQLTDYEEYYAISHAQQAAFADDPVAARRFAAECRRQEHDDLLILKPGWMRGTPW